MRKMFSDSSTVMKMVSVVLLIFGVLSFMAGYLLSYDLEQDPLSEERQAQLEAYRVEQAEALGLPTEIPVPVEPQEETPPVETEGEQAEGDAQEAVEMTPGLEPEVVLAYFKFLAMLYLFEGMVQLLAGIVGLVRHSRPDAQVLPMIMAVSMLLVWIVRLFMGDGDLLHALFTLVLPVMYLYASILIRRNRKPDLRRL